MPGGETWYIAGMIFVKSLTQFHMGLIIYKVKFIITHCIVDMGLELRVPKHPVK